MVYLLYRAIPKGYIKTDRGYKNYISSIGCAFSEDGINFSRFNRPAIEPKEDYDKLGCEDPRVTKLEIPGYVTYLIAYTALSNAAYSSYGYRVALASTEDFRTFEKHGVAIPGLKDKDAVIFPGLIGGRIAMLHWVKPDIQIVYFSDFDHLIHPDELFWREYRTRLEDYVVMRPQFTWEEKIGSGCPPVKTAEGWLLIYHAKDDKGIYRAGVALLDLEEPARVIARSPQPILEPETVYERIGDVNNVVFPQSAVVKDDTLYVYYGAADKVCCLATARLDDLVDFVTQFKSERVSKI